jgi:tRNA(adenine34) deaminase
MDRRFMDVALEAAEQALSAGEVPVAAALVVAGDLWAVAHNRREASGDVTAHAEIEVLRAAGARTRSWRLPREAWLYVTLEPCLMCAAAMRDAHVAGLVFGADDPRKGAAGSVYHVLADGRLGPPVPVLGGIEADRAQRLLDRFFRDRRPSSGGVSEPG